MKKNLLFTTALVATTFTASGVLAADPVSITTQEALNQYIDSGKGASWTDIVTISGVQNGEVKNNNAQNRFIEADDLQIENSTVTVDGKGNFIGGDNVNIQKGSTINLTNDGHLLVTREEDPNIVNTLTIAGTVNMNEPIIRAASSNTIPASHRKVVLEEGGFNNVEGNDNTIASRETIVNGQINVNSGMLDLTGGLTRGEDGILSKGEADKAKEASFTIGKTGALTIEQGATANSNASDIFNNGTITNNGTFNIAGDYNSDGGKYNGGYTQTGGSINLTNGAELISGLSDEYNKKAENTVALNNVEEINISNGSAIHAVYLDIQNDEGKTTKINIAGNNPDAGRPQLDDKSDTWRNNAQLLSYGDATLNNAEINIGEGGMLLQGALGDGNGERDKSQMTLQNSKVVVAEGGLIKATNDSTYGLNTTEIDLAGRIEANIKEGTDSTINVTGSKAYIEKITDLANLNIVADAASASLFSKGASVTTTTVANGKSFVLDSASADNLFKTGTLDVNGTLRISDKANTAGYSIAQTNVASHGVLDLGKNVYKSDVTLDNGATLNVGIGEEGDKIVNGKIDGSLKAASGEGEQSNLNLIFDEGLSNEDLKEGIEFASSAEGNLAL